MTADSRVADGEAIKVTPEMLRAGRDALIGAVSGFEGCDPEALDRAVVASFRVMAAMAAEADRKSGLKGMARCEGNPLDRLRRAITGRERILVLGPPMWERIELLDILAKSIPRERRVIVHDDNASRDPKLREEALPCNRLILNYNVEGSNVPFEKVAVFQSSSDHVIVPNLDVSDLDACKRHVFLAREGAIVATHLWSDDQRLQGIADVIVEIKSDQAAPLGIGDRWERRAWVPMG